MSQFTCAEPRRLNTCRLDEGFDDIFYFFGEKSEGAPDVVLGADL